MVPSAEVPRPVATVPVQGSMPVSDTIAAVRAPVGWLKGSTHVHAAPSGDSSAPLPTVMRWYRDHHYDFIVLTDHNRVTVPSVAQQTAGGAQLLDVRITDSAPAVRSGGMTTRRAQRKGNRGPLRVLLGSELTHNPGQCEPAPPPESPKCRIHVNAIAVAQPAARASAQPISLGSRNAGHAASPALPAVVANQKFEWAKGLGRQRTTMYRQALALVAQLGGARIASLNHPQWHWGMTEAVLLGVASEARAQGTALLYEVANAQFAGWNQGDATHPGTEALWDVALRAGYRIWAVASDDAHDYDGKGKYPPGGGFVMVRARGGQDIARALRDGDFYGSTGVVLREVRVGEGKLHVEVAETARPDGPGADARAAVAIRFVVNGIAAANLVGLRGAHALPPEGYVRAVITRGDGAQAWTQPVWASSQLGQ